jgi:putative transposase
MSMFPTRQALTHRRTTVELQRCGLAVNHKRVLREDNFLCLRERKLIRTTEAHDRLLAYPNLVSALTVSGPNRLWVADIPSIRLRQEFIYLAVLLDAWSRRCIGWALDCHLAAELALAALRMALATRQVPPGPVHHSDRGVPYASQAYTTLLKAYAI